MKQIHLWGVKQNNLKDIEVKIPLGSFAVICGPSGSGKSSLAFETLYAEGQRRYIESLSNYTRQFLNKAPKPDIEGINNIPPAIALEQKNSVKTSRSTVGTTTEIVDYLRLLYEKIGKTYCPDHHILLEKDNLVSSTKKILSTFADERGYILAPIFAEGRALNGRKLYTQLVQDGYLRIYTPAKAKVAKKKTTAKRKKTTKKALSEAALAQETLPIFSQQDIGTVIELSDAKLKKSVPKSDFYIVIDRLAFKKNDSGRLTDSLSQAYKASLKYNLHILSAESRIITTDGKQLLLNENFSCSICGYKFPNITSQLFSFNSPAGACSSCNGFGNTLTIDENKVVPNPQLTLSDGALTPFEMPSAKKDKRSLISFCKKNKIDTNTPWQELPNRHRRTLWQGNKDFYGIEGLFKYLERKKYKMHVRVFLARYKSPTICKNCKGTRLKPEAQQVLVGKKSISDLCSLSIEELQSFVSTLKLSTSEMKICQEVYQQVLSRLGFLIDVGVPYLTLDRPTKTLSGGEYQRLSLSNQLGMGLSQTLYVLDEPTVGLHPRDNERLIKVLHQIKDLGNTLVVVEHDHDVIRSSSFVIEMGPGSGYLGGEILFSGDKKDFYNFKESNTLSYLIPNAGMMAQRTPRPVDISTYRYKLELTGCNGNNLKNVDLTIPLNRLVTVTGVSGSGKSTLISHTLYPAVAKALNIEFTQGFDYQKLEGTHHFKNVLLIDQTPIGKTARSNPMTYMKIYDYVRTLFATTNEARARGYTPGTFSLNVDGGRCPVCKGLGFEVIDMIFMDDIHIPCDACDGNKFRSEVLEITFKGKTIKNIMEMTVAQAIDFFVPFPNIRRPLTVLKEVGLEYICLGQSAKTLSGGESQRLKVAKELNLSSHKSTLYILDEPTTGLHFREVHMLMRMLNRLVESGSSVVLIEHNLEVIRNSDYIIDIGPEAGTKGGKIVAQGTALDIMSNKKSHTGNYLKDYIKNITPQHSFGEPIKGNSYL